MHLAVEGQPHFASPPKTGKTKKKVWSEKPFFTNEQRRDADRHAHEIGHFPDP